MVAAKSAGIWIGLVLASVGVLLAGWVMIHDQRMAHTTAVVEKIVTGTDAAGELTYSAVFRYRAEDGVVHWWTVPTGTNQDKYKEARQFAVEFPHGEPQNVRLATKVALYGTAIEIAATGFVLFDIGCVFWIKCRLFELRRNGTIRR